MNDAPAASDTTLETRAVNTIRGLSMDAPHAARSGHQGTAMALAPLAHVLYTRVMKYDASAPDWFDRDRFVLSCGHASILQYSMLHLTGFGLTLDDLKDFRQWGSATPGHPEVGHTSGVEVTTGPLGQGVANAVGMALAERIVRSRFGPEVCDHRTWVVCSDGDLSEGISHEAASLAGHLGLGQLICIYDDNKVTIDGPTDLALSDDPVRRFQSYGWHVIDAGEIAEDLDALERVLNEAAAETDRPSMIVLRSHIGFPSPSLTDAPAAHGLAFGADEIAEAKAVMGLPDEPFTVDADVLALYRDAGTRGADERRAWAEREASFSGGAEGRPAWDAVLSGTPLDGWRDGLPTYEVGDSVATRKAAGQALASIAGAVPALLGGGADLTGNTGTDLGLATQSAADPAGRQVYFGIREHAMGAVMNGAALHGGALPVGGTFLVFSDYMRPAVRLAALSGAHCIFAWTHDSVGVGEDGPTHQPVEHIAALRAIPGLTVIRPGDANETAEAVALAIESDGPTALILSRQGVPVLEGTADAPVDRGAYVLTGAEDPDVVLVGTGSELALCVEAAATLEGAGVAARVVSMPSCELFERLDRSEQTEVLPPGVPVVSIEAGVTQGWHRWADTALGIDRFGASAPGSRVMAELGMTAGAVVAAAQALLSRS